MRGAFFLFCCSISRHREAEARLEEPFEVEIGRKAACGGDLADWRIGVRQEVADLVKSRPLDFIKNRYAEFVAKKLFGRPSRNVHQVDDVWNADAVRRVEADEFKRLVQVVEVAATQGRRGSRDNPRRTIEDFGRSACPSGKKVVQQFDGEFAGSSVVRFDAGEGRPGGFAKPRVVVAADDGNLIRDANAMRGTEIEDGNRAQVNRGMERTGLGQCLKPASEILSSIVDMTAFVRSGDNLSKLAFAPTRPVDDGIRTDEGEIVEAEP